MRLVLSERGSNRRASDRTFNVVQTFRVTMNCLNVRSNMNGNDCKKMLPFGINVR